MKKKVPSLLITNVSVPGLLPGSSALLKTLVKTLWRETSELLFLWTTGRISLIPPHHWEPILCTICLTSVRNVILQKWSWIIKSLLPPRAIYVMTTLRPAMLMTETSATQTRSHLPMMDRPKWCKQPWPRIPAILTNLILTGCTTPYLERLSISIQVVNQFTTNEFETMIFFF